MMIGTKQIKVGMVIKYQNEIWRVMEATHFTPGNLGAFMQVKMRNVIKGHQTQHKFRTAESVEKVSLDVVEVDFLYQEGNQYHFMNTETYDQFAVEKEMLDGKEGYLSPGLRLTVELLEGRPLGVQMPKKVQVTIAECEPYIKTATATNSFKQAKTETGASVQVPGFIEVGEVVEVDTESGQYANRVKD